MPPYSNLNRSLIRGIEILRCFKPGMDLLGNGEIAERTHLPPSTVSRLTQTLVQSGYLEHDHRNLAYRLAPTVLSLGHAFKTASLELKVTEPLMRKASERHKLNVGLAVADRMEMVYLDSIRYSKNVSLRTVVAGQRVPIEQTSLGRAWISTLEPRERAEYFKKLKMLHPKSYKKTEREILKAIESIALRGYCMASWLPEISAISIPVYWVNGRYASLNFSTPVDSHLNSVIESYAPYLIELRDKLELNFKTIAKQN